MQRDGLRELGQIASFVEKRCKLQTDRKLHSALEEVQRRSSKWVGGRKEVKMEESKRLESRQSGEGASIEAIVGE